MTSPQPSVKEQMVQIIHAQPDDSSFDEILRELAFARMIYFVRLRNQGRSGMFTEGFFALSFGTLIVAFHNCFAKRAKRNASDLPPNLA